MRKIITAFAISLLCVGAMGQPSILLMTNFLAGLPTMTNGYALLVSTNDARPASFQPQYGGPTTNVLIDANYTGTIQVGTNFFTAKDLQSIPHGNFAVWNPPNNTIWLGWPEFGRLNGVDDVGFPPASLVDKEHEIGLRPDGTVVWRKVK